MNDERVADSGKPFLVNCGGMQCATPERGQDPATPSHPEENIHSSLLSLVCRKEIRSLYGIRAFSALVVLFYHLGLSSIPGTYGVTAFFVLSGFLITHLLILENQRTGSISLRAFYTRRTFRIFPAFYVFAAVAIGARMITGAPLRWAQTWTSLTYTGNYYLAFMHDAASTMGHTWSLAVEEQFYLLWPFLFKRFRDRPALMIRILTIAIVTVWLYRAVLSLIGVHADYLYYTFEARLDALAVGCLTALAIHAGYQFRWLLRSPWISILIVAGMATMPIIGAMYTPRLATNAVIVNALLPVLCGLFMIHSIYFSEHPLYWILNNPAVNYLGLISYSIYLYHPLFIHRSSPGTPVMWVTASIAGCLLVASASYFFVERPFLRLKSRFSARTATAALRTAELNPNS